MIGTQEYQAGRSGFLRALASLRSLVRESSATGAEKMAMLTQLDVLAVGEMAFAALEAVAHALHEEREQLSHSILRLEAALRERR